MDFEEFCAATLSVHQLEAVNRWEQHARIAYELFEKDGNRAIVIEELASVRGDTLFFEVVFVDVYVGNNFLSYVMMFVNDFAGTWPWSICSTSCSSS